MLTPANTKTLQCVVQNLEDLAANSVHLAKPGNTLTYKTIGTMNKYFTIKNEHGRYMKTGGNGWCNNLKGAVIGTEAQMKALIEQKKNSPYQMLLEYIGESESGWISKNEKVREFNK